MRLNRPGTKPTLSPLAAHIGQQLFKLRQKQLATMRDVSEMTGLSHAFISQLENGQSCPGAQTLWTLSQQFDVPISYWFRGYEE